MPTANIFFILAAAAAAAVLLIFIFIIIIIRFSFHFKPFIALYDIKWILKMLFNHSFIITLVVLEGLFKATLSIAFFLILHLISKTTTTTTNIIIVITVVVVVAFAVK